MAGKCSVKLRNIRVIEAGFYHCRFQIIVTHYLWDSPEFLESVLMGTYKMMLVLRPDSFFTPVPRAGKASGISMVGAICLLRDPE